MKEVISPNVKIIGPEQAGLHKLAHGLTMANGDVCCLLDSSDYNARFVSPDIVVLELALQKSGGGDYRYEIQSGFSEAFTAMRDAGGVYAVNVTGLPTDDQKVGSYRFCAWNEQLASAITKIIKKKNLFELISTSGVFCDGGTIGECAHFAGVSKYFRCMSYSKGGEHYPHFDSDFVMKGDASTGYATLYSMVLYTEDCDSGALAFVNPPDGSDRSDWDRQAHPEEIYHKEYPRVGKIVIFRHSLCHTVLPFSPSRYECRRIIRGDLIFTKEAK
jgi:hypothetical protein